MIRCSYLISLMDGYMTPHVLADTLLASKVDMSVAGIYPRYITLIEISWDNMLEDMKSISKKDGSICIRVQKENGEGNINTFYFKDGKAYMDIENTGYYECLLNDNENGIMPTYKALEWSRSSFFSTKECNPPADLLVLAIGEYGNPLVSKRTKDSEWAKGMDIKYWKFI